MVFAGIASVVSAVIAGRRLAVTTQCRAERNVAQCVGRVRHGDGRRRAVVVAQHRVCTVRCNEKQTLMSSRLSLSID